MYQFVALYPGQGAQFVGMLNQLAATFPLITRFFSQASAVLGYDLWQLTQQGPAEVLNETSKTQPALLTASVAIYHLWLEQGGRRPIAMAGHSLGELSALVCADVIAFTDAVKLVELRGNLMQRAVPMGAGAMYVVLGLEDQRVIQACQESAQGDIVAAANFNAPGQVVIAGSTAAVVRAAQRCKVAGARRVLALPVSVPSHCLLMKPIAEEFAQALTKIKFNEPAIPVINNVDVKCETEPAKIRSALTRQLYNPVRWSACIEHIANEMRAERQIEMGPGKVLSGLTGRITDVLSISAINDPISLETALKLEGSYEL